MPGSAAPDLPAGSLLAHYRIEEKIGEGAMGVVYRAHDEGLDRKVAVKVLRPGASGMTIRVDRFFREARAAARVNHPNLTHVHYVGGDGSYRFFAMEYVNGSSLDEHVAQSDPIDLDAGIDMLSQAAAGLAAAHEVGIVHRDVKPSNILVLSSGRVKMTDFGLSKSIEADVAQSQDGAVTGTPTYMSPEQCRSRKVDARADIYSLGITAWSMFVGSQPFPGPNLGDVINDQINTPLPSLRARRPDLPRSIERVIEKMCEKKPEDRPADMREVIDLLESCRPRAVHPAPIMARAVAVGLDLLVAGVAMITITFAIALASGAADNVDVTVDGPLQYAIFSFLFVAATVTAEARYGLTLGKWFLNLCVRRKDGSDAPTRSAFLRAVTRFPALVFTGIGLGMIPVVGELGGEFVEMLAPVALVGGLICFYVTKGKTLSDLLTGTRVVYAMPPDERRTRRRLD